jgi:hypothetical protein
MSEFLKVINENIPTDDIDSLIEGKRALQRYLFDNGISVEVKSFKDIIKFKLPDGTVVDVEVINVTKGAVAEDGETESVASTIKAIADMPDGGLMTSTGRKFKKAKNTMANAAVKIAKKFEAAAE